jgi:superoxide dismutase, Cu-Zn family
MRPRSIFAVAVAVAVSATAARALTEFAPMWMGSVAGKDGSAITGNATMKPGADGKSTTVDVELKGDAPNLARPWHIHTGSCAASGGVFGGGRSYTPIAIDAQGGGKSTATLPVVMPDTGKYYVNIHESSANMGKIVACGDLSFHNM